MVADPDAETVRARVIAILAEQALCDPARLSDEMTLDAMGLDSLSLVEAVFALEQSFGVTMPFETDDGGAAGFEAATIGAVVAAIGDMVRGNEGGQ